MSISKDLTTHSEKGTTAGILHPPTLTVVAGTGQAGTINKPVNLAAAAKTNERDWDPYLVWKKLIKKSSD